MIPRVIYRTWSTTDLPLPFQRAWNFTREHNPMYVQKLFTDVQVYDFLKKYYSNHPIWKNRVIDAYYSINPIYGTARADLFRYALLYEHGGVYLDAKSAARNISGIVRKHDGFITAHWSFFSIPRYWSSLHLRTMQGEYEQWWMASRRKHPVLAKIINMTISNIETYSNVQRETYCNFFKNFFGDSLLLYLVPYCKGTDILWTTGPFVFSRSIDACMHKYETQGVRILWPDGDNTFIYDYAGVHREYGNHYWAQGAQLVHKMNSTTW